MVNNKKVLSILLLFLVSLTAIFATSVASDLTISLIDSNVTVSHGASQTGDFNLTNTNTSQNLTVELVSNAQSGLTVSFNETTKTVVNSTTETVSYTVITDSNLAPGNYIFNITALNDSNSNDNVTSSNVTVTVPIDSTMTADMVDASKTSTNRSSNYTFTIPLNNTGNINGIWTNFTVPTLILNWDDESNISSTTNLPDINITAGTDTATLSITYELNDSVEYGIYSGTLTYNIENGDPQSINLELSVFENRYDEDLKITVDNLEDITNDDKKTYPGDIIKIEDIEIENNYSPDNEDSIDDVDLEYRVYQISDGEEIVDETYYESFDIEEGEDSEKFDIKFQIPYDSTQGEYMVELIAIGTIYSDDGTDSNDGEEIVGRYYESFDVDTKSRHMILKELLVDSYCPGNEAELIIELVNIGENDLDEDDDMFVKIKISEFDYEEWHNVTQDIDVGDVETMTINIDIPSTAAIGNHAVEITTKHKSNTNSNLDGSEYASIITLGSTCSGSASSSTTALAGQSSEEGTQGMNTKYTLTVTNNGDFAATYNIEVVGVDAWGAAVVSPEIVSVPAGGTSTFSVYLQPGNNAQSTNNAVINLKSGGEIVSSKTLTLTISGMSISTLTDSLFGNTSLQLGNISLTTIISLLVVLGTASGAIWLVHGEQIRSSQKKKKRKSKKRRK